MIGTEKHNRHIAQKKYGSAAYE